MNLWCKMLLSFYDVFWVVVLCEVIVFVLCFFLKAPWVVCGILCGLGGWVCVGFGFVSLLMCECEYLISIKVDVVGA